MSTICILIVTEIIDICLINRIYYVYIKYKHLIIILLRLQMAQRKRTISKVCAL